MAENQRPEDNWPPELLSGVDAQAVPSAHIETEGPGSRAPNVSDDDLEDEGIFADSRSLFDTPGKEDREDHKNPPITRAEEMQVEATPKGVNQVAQAALKAGAGLVSQPIEAQATPPPTMERRLVAVFDRTGRPMVAMTVNGRRVENFRKPTKAEWDALGQRGRLVKGGIGTVDASGQPSAVTAMVVPGGAPKGTPTWMWVAGLAAVAGGAYWWWKRSKTLEENTEVE